MPSPDPWSQSLTDFCAFLAGLSSVQEFLGADDETEAAEAIYKHEAEEDAPLPLIVVTLGDGNTLTVASVDGMVLQTAGSFLVRLMAENDGEMDMDAAFSFAGGIAQEACQATAQSVAADVPAITSATLVSLRLSGEKGDVPDGACWITDLSFAWGINQ
jgi:hypothetical protein